MTGKKYPTVIEVRSIDYPRLLLDPVNAENPVGQGSQLSRQRYAISLEDVDGEEIQFHVAVEDMMKFLSESFHRYETDIQKFDGKVIRKFRGFDDS